MHCCVHYSEEKFNAITKKCQGEAGVEVVVGVARLLHLQWRRVLPECRSKQQTSR